MERLVLPQAVTVLIIIIMIIIIIIIIMIIIIIIIVFNIYMAQINIQEDMIKCALHIKIESKITSKT